jgi:hypothetical protein
MSGAGEKFYAAGFSSFGGPAKRRVIPAISQLDLDHHHRQSSSTTIPQPTCTYAPA